MKLTRVQKLSLTVSAALTVVGGFGAGSYYFASRTVLSDRAVERANGNMAAALTLIVARQDGERATKAYVVRPDSATRAAVHAAQMRAEDALDALARGTEDNPRQARAIQALGAGVSQGFDTFRGTLLGRDRAGADSARRILASDRTAQSADSLMALVALIRDEELRVLAEKTRLQSAHSTQAQRVILAGMLLAFLLAGVAFQPVRAHVATRITSSIVREHVVGAADVAEATRARANATGQLQALHRLAAELAETVDESRAAASVVAAAQPLQPTMAAALVPADGQGFGVAAASIPSLAQTSAALNAAAASVLRSGNAAMATSRAERSRLWGELPELDSCGARGALLLVPLARNGAAIGVLALAFDGDRDLAADDLDFAATVGRIGGQFVAFRPSTF
jgi:CHASE3 domain sensor protein